MTTYRYNISTQSTGGVFRNIEADTPKEAIDKLGKDAFGKWKRLAHAVRIGDDGSWVQGTIIRGDKSAEFHED